jgi:ionotropic glutamate receptor
LPTVLLSIFSILQLLNRRQLEKFKEKWWRKDEISAKCEKPEDQADGISIQNIGGVFIVIFVGIGMACITLAFEFWYYKLRKTPKIVSSSHDEYKFAKGGDMATMKNNLSFGSGGGLIDPTGNSLKSRHPPNNNNFRARF